MYVPTYPYISRNVMRGKTAPYYHQTKSKGLYSTNNIVVILLRMSVHEFQLVNLVIIEFIVLLEHLYHPLLNTKISAISNHVPGGNVKLIVRPYISQQKVYPVSRVQG